MGSTVFLAVGRSLGVAFLAVALLVAATASGSGVSRPVLPTPPRLFDTTYVTPSGRSISVRAGEDFQAVLDAAQPGDVIALEAGATFRGNFILRRKSGPG